MFLYLAQMRAQQKIPTFYIVQHQNQSNGDVSALDLDPAKASHTEPPQVKSTHPLKKIAKGLGNIVTSWGAPATRVIADPPDNTEGRLPISAH